MASADSVVTDGIKLSSIKLCDPPKAVTDFITELITFVTNNNYLIPPEQLISETIGINTQDKDYTISDITSGDNTISDITNGDNTISDTISDITNGDNTISDITNGDNTISDTISDITNGDINTISDITNEDINTVSDITNGDINTISDITNGDNTISDTISDITNGDINTISDITNEDINTISNITNGDINTISDITNGDINTISDITNEDNTISNITNGDHTVSNITNEDINTILHPPVSISYERDMFYICLRFKEFLHWSMCFRSPQRRLDLVQLTGLIPGLSVKRDICYRSHVRLQQVKVLKQFVGGYCGHYAYYNGLTLLRALSAGDQLISLVWMFLTGQRLAFWKRYWETIRLLSSYAVLAGEVWPWVVSDIERGCVERTYMSYLLSSDPSLLCLGRDRMHVLQFGFGSIQSPKRDLFSLHKALQELLHKPAASSLAIMLGVTNHWLAAVIYKIHTIDETWTCNTLKGVKESNELGENDYVYRVVFMDSNNAPIIEATDSALEAYYTKHVARYARRRKEEMTAWKRETFRQALEDERELMRIVISCVSEGNLLYHSLKANVHRMMLNFYIHVDTVCQMRRLEYIPDIPIPWFLKHKNHANPTNPDYQKYSTTGYSSPPDVDHYLLTLMAWLEGWYRPRDIRTMVCGDMREFSIPELEPELNTCLCLWSSHLLSVLTGANQLAFPILIEFVDVLIDIASTLNAT